MANVVGHPSSVNNVYHNVCEDTVQFFVTPFGSINGLEKTCWSGNVGFMIPCGSINGFEKTSCKVPTAGWAK